MNKLRNQVNQKWRKHRALHHHINHCRNKAVIKSADMPEDMQMEAVDMAIYALEQFNMEKDVAQHLKREFDKKHGQTWNCIVGRNFGSYVTHETGVCLLVSITNSACKVSIVHGVSVWKIVKELSFKPLR
jgi:dynein light chain LC8-type